MSDASSSPSPHAERPLTAGRCEKARPESAVLVVLLHHVNTVCSSADDSLRDVQKAVDEIYHHPDVLAPRLPANPISFEDPTAVAWRVVAEIDARWDAHRDAGHPLEKVILIGHSFGALIARMTYLLACGESPVRQTTRKGGATTWILQDDAGNARNPFAENPPAKLRARPWAAQVDRMVLFAGMNRGWTVDFRVQGLAKALQNQFGVALVSAWQLLGNLLRGWPWRKWRPSLIMSFRRGATFVSELRWQWIEMKREPFDGPNGVSPLGRAPVIQFLGSRDDRVSPEDNIDLVSGQDFFYREMPRSGHPDVISLRLRTKEDGPAPPSGGPDPARLADVRLDRGERLREMLLTPAAELESELPADTFGPGRPPSDAARYQGVVFVIHGIRDQGYWTKKIAWRIQHRARQAGLRFAAVTESYGYLPMLPFLLPWERRQKVQWLVDRYVEACAAYPDAEFHYVGHSNGTYLLARALLDYPFMQFGHIVFAGSVVPTRYPWRRLQREGRIKGVLNYIATQDWVVAFFPKLFQFPNWLAARLPAQWNWTGLQDLGSGGHDGFSDLEFPAASRPVPFSAQPRQQMHYAHGAHAAALVEENWPTIAEAVVLGTPSGAPPVYVQNRDRRARIFDIISWAPVVVWGAILLALYGILCALLGTLPGEITAGLRRLLIGLSEGELPALLRAAGLVLYYHLLKFALLRL